MLGEEIEKVSTHRQRLELELGPRTYSKDRVRLAAPDRVRQAERDTGAAGLHRGASMQELVDRLALVLGEHMHDGDELHVTYNAMQSGWHEHPRPRAV